MPCDASEREQTDNSIRGKLRVVTKKLQELRQEMTIVDEYYKEMEVSMIRANVLESQDQTMASFLNGLNNPIKKIVEFQPYDSLVALVHQATKVERQIMEDVKYAKQRLTLQPSQTPQCL